jgi:hypothetical protein
MKLYHLAIPKTATESLQMSMKDAGLDVYVTMKNEPTLNYVEAASHKIISGHFHYGIHNLISLRDTSKYFTVLRNPIQRAVSDYYHHRYVNTDWVKDMSLIDYINAVPENVISTQMFGFGIREYHEAIKIIQTDYCLIGTMSDLKSFYNGLSELFGVELKHLWLHRTLKPDYHIDSKTTTQFVNKHKLDYMIWEKILSAVFY